MENETTELTPERVAAIAAARSLFGVRPGTSHTETPDVFMVLPEEERPAFTFEYMTSTTKAEYAVRMEAIFGDTLDGLEGDERRMKAQRVLREKRSENNEVTKWVVCKQLRIMTRYPDVHDGSPIECEFDKDGLLSLKTWDAIDVKLHAVLGDLVLAKNFMSDVEAVGVKS